MSLLNDMVPLIETYTDPVIRYFHHENPTSGLAMLHDYLKEHDLWYCMFTTTTSFQYFPIVDIMGPEVYQRVVDKTASIVLDLSFEPFLASIDRIYEDVIKAHNIPPSQVIFMSNMYDAREYNIEAAKRYGCEPMRIFWFSALEYMIHRYTVDTNPPSLEVRWYEKKFLNLNRRWRVHRPLLTLLLYDRGLLDKGHVSFGPCENHGNWENIWDGLKVGAIGNYPMINAIHRSESIKNMPPLYLDTDELHTNRAELDISTDKFYADSYFSLVSETTFYNRDSGLNSRFITEKTFKAIIMKHPFILVTIPKSLEILQLLGYKTFAPWIDERYDQEMDDNKRMMMIVDEVERLSNLSPADLERFLLEVNAICDYNYNVLKNKTKFIYEMGEQCLAI